MKNQKEAWLPVRGYENKYEVSSFGRVKSLNFNRTKKEKILKECTSSTGYSIVLLYLNGVRTTNQVHQLVAMAFLNHKPCGHKLVVNHKDFNKQNNNVSNLEIITARENTNQKHLKSTSKYIGVSWRKKYKKWVAQIMINKKKLHLGHFTNEYEAHLAYQKALDLIIKN